MSDSRERFEKFWLKDVPEKHRTFARAILAGYGPEYAASPSVSGAWSAWQAAERDALERAAKVCEEWSCVIDTGKRRNRVVAAAMQGALTCAAAIRALTVKG